MHPPSALALLSSPSSPFTVLLSHRKVRLCPAFLPPVALLTRCRADDDAAGQRAHEYAVEQARATTSCVPPSSTLVARRLSVLRSTSLSRRHTDVLPTALLGVAACPPPRHRRRELPIVLSGGTAIRYQSGFRLGTYRHVPVQPRPVAVPLQLPSDQYAVPDT